MMFLTVDRLLEQKDYDERAKDLLSMKEILKAPDKPEHMERCE